MGNRNYALQPPSTNDPAAWHSYWQAKNQLWRTKPEISQKRQEELVHHRKIVPDLTHGIYPFRDMKLDRADVEWLLATHDTGRGPVNWDNEQDRKRIGLDLRGADLCQVDLNLLPLTRLHAGLTFDEHLKAAFEQRHMAVVRMKQANLKGAQLEEANLKGAQLEGADLRRAQLKGANLTEAQLEGADLRGAQLEGANLVGAQLKGANLSEAQLKQANLIGAQLEGANLSEAQLEGANLVGAQLEGADLRGAQLKGANLRYAQLEGANLRGAQLEGAGLIDAQLEGADLEGAQLKKANLIGAQLKKANLIGAQLEGADLRGAQLKGASLRYAQLEGVDLRGAQLEGADLIETQLKGANLIEAQLKGADLREAQLEGVNLRDVTFGTQAHIGPRLADAQWGTINLAVVDWSQVTTLGDEWEAEKKRQPSGEKKEKEERLSDYRAAVRANRQLAVALQAQGLSEEAARFAYRAQRLQRIVLRRQKKIGPYIFSSFLDLLAGYGYKPGRSVIAYLLLIVGFALTYYSFGHLAWYEALVVSLTAFHGRGFFAQQFQPGDPQSIIAALEAVVGLLIEISFIATFTQRFFGK